ncbi:retrotransposon hot spot (RHS) protein, partial [Trypanosoma cruzi]
MCPRPLAECVRRRRCHTGAGPWRAGCVREPSVRTTLLLLLLAFPNTVLGGWQPLAVVAVVLVHVVCVARCVDDSLVLTARRDCACCSHISHFPPLIGDQCSALTRANCG